MGRSTRMPNPVNHKRDVQWDHCDRCDFLYPINQLIKQKGLILCGKCWDDLSVERRYIDIERILNQGVDQEGVDMRYVDRGFFDGFDESNM